MVFVILYKEMETALTINSHYSKHALMNRHPNIKVSGFFSVIVTTSLCVLFNSYFPFCSEYWGVGTELFELLI